MARSGLYKLDVKKARDALIAQGKRPSVDAVRITLGNTGSKTTIHKYLKELEEEEGHVGDRKTSLSEALHDLVERLAVQLQGEADAQVDAIRAEHSEKERHHAEVVAKARQEIERLRTQQQSLETALLQEQAAHALSREALQRETIARHTAEQQSTDLKERLTENEAHRASLEDKHRHAYEALDHYRQSVKDQREQDQRRHDQQLQQLQSELRQVQQAVVVKQDEITRLNHEGVHLVTELSHMRRAFFDEQSNNKRLAHTVEQQQGLATRCAVLEASIVEREARIAALQEQVAAAEMISDSATSQLSATQLGLSTASAQLAAANILNAELRSLISGDHLPKPAST